MCDVDSCSMTVGKPPERLVGMAVNPADSTGSRETMDPEPGTDAKAKTEGGAAPPPSPAA